MTALDAHPAAYPLMRLSTLVRDAWLPLSLCGLLLVVASSSLTAARWVSEGSRYTRALWLGAMFGALLAASRFRPRTAFAYSVVMGAAIGAEAAGRVLPTFEQVEQSRWPELLWGMHVRALTLSDQAGSWARAIAFDGTVREAGLFIALMASLLWSMGLWLAWSLIRRRQALAGLAPLVVGVALNNTLASRPAAEYAMLLAPMLLLLGHNAYRRARHDWEQRRVSYAEYLEADWLINAAVAVTVIMLLVVASPFLGTPSGWRLLSDLVRTTQSRTADTASRLFGGVNPPRAPGLAVTARTPDLSLIRSPVPRGDETVMWVTVSDPAPIPPGMTTAGSLPPTHYWRSQVFATYTGQGWEPVSVPDGAMLDAQAGPPPARYVLHQQFEIVAAHGPELFAVNAPVAAGAGVEVIALPLATDALLRGDSSTYTVTSWATQRSAVRMTMETATGEAAQALAEYVQLPASLPQRVRDLAQRIAGEAPTPMEKAERIQNYLRATYPYLRDVPTHAPEQDAVDYFLFDAPGGNCNYSASAMAVLLRTLDVPARVAVGYATGSFDFERGAYRVSNDSAHAWVEVYLAGAGWVEFEPTASRPALNYGLAEETLATPTGATRAAEQPFNWIVPALLALAVAALGWTLWRARPRPRTEPAARLYWQMRRALAWAGLRGTATTTPEEFSAASATRLAGRRTLSAALAQATTLYEQALYGSRPVNEGELWRTQQLWRSARREWLAAWAGALDARLRKKGAAGVDGKTP